MFIPAVKTIGRGQKWWLYRRVDICLSETTGFELSTQSLSTHCKHIIDSVFESPSVEPSLFSRLFCTQYDQLL